jgi:hypothetical protein
VGGCGGRGAALRRAVFAAGGVARAALGRGRGHEGVSVGRALGQGERVRYHCMAGHSVYGEYQLRGAILDAWGNIGCVGQYWLRVVGHSWESTARSTPA